MNVLYRLSVPEDWYDMVDKTFFVCFICGFCGAFLIGTITFIIFSIIGPAKYISVTGLILACLNMAYWFVAGINVITDWYDREQIRRVKS